VHSFYPYTDKVEIPPCTPDGTWHTTDVASLLENDDAVGVIVQLEAISGGQPSVGCIGIDQHHTSYIAALVNGGYNTTVAWFRPESGKQIETRREDGAGRFYIVGEFRSPNVRFHLWDSAIDAIVLHPLEGSGDQSTWVDQTVTLVGDDAVSDVEAVIIDVRALASVGTWSARKKGSAWTPVSVHTVPPITCSWRVVPVDSNGQYQTYFSAKAFPEWGDHFEAYEVGYIKKSAYKGIESPVDEGLSTANEWQTVDFSGSVPANARTIVASWLYPTGTCNSPVACLRRIGSSDGPVKLPTQSSGGAQVVRLNSDLQCEAYLSVGAGAMDLYVLGYEEYAGDGSLNIDSGVLNIRTGVVNVR
jgi:hypothetical protein